MAFPSAANSLRGVVYHTPRDQRKAITKTPLASEAEIKCAIRQVYRGFLQPRALMHILRRNLFDFGFYYRGFRYLLGHLGDFGG